MKYIEAERLPAIIADVENEYGYFILLPNTEVLWEVHTALSSEAKGVADFLATQAMIDAFNKYPKLMKIITFIPENNPLAKRLAKRCGFREEGFITKSYKEGNDMIGQYIYGVAREDVCQ